MFSPSLLSALDLGTTLATSLIIFVFLFLSTFFIGIGLGRIKVFQHEVLLFLIEGSLLRSWEDLFECLQVVGLKFVGLGEFHLKLDDEISVTHLISVERHTLIFNDFLLTLLNYLSWWGCYGKLGVIEMFYGEVESS